MVYCCIHHFTDIYYSEIIYHFTCAFITQRVMNAQVIDFYPFCWQLYLPNMPSLSVYLKWNLSFYRLIYVHRINKRFFNALIQTHSHVPSDWISPSNREYSERWKRQLSSKSCARFIHFDSLCLFLKCQLFCRPSVQVSGRRMDARITNNTRHDRHCYPTTELFPGSAECILSAN